MTNDIDVKIFVSHRIDKDSEVLDNPFFIPVRCGAVYDNHAAPSTIGDDTGDNISQKKAKYGELTVQYWAWKNIEADYYGLCHYRRYLSFSSIQHETLYSVSKDWKEVIHNEVVEDYFDVNSQKKYGLDNPETIKEMLLKYDIVVNDWADVSKMVHSCPYKMGGGIASSVREYYQAYEDILLPVNSISILEDVVSELYPSLFCSLLDYLQGKKYLGYNCFIMKKEFFFNYSSFLFGTLFEIEKRLPISKYASESMNRAYGFISEILFGTYVLYLSNNSNCKIKHLQLVFFRDTEKRESFFPVKTLNNIPIVMMSSNYYVPYLSCCLYSLIENSSEKYFYDIIILHKEITNENISKLKEICISKSNVSIRFYNPKRLLQDVKFYIASSVYAEEAYYRLLAPWILINYSKAIVMDCDIILTGDIADLYNIDITDYLIGAVKDIVFQGMINDYTLDVKKYATEEMGMDNPYDYVNTGVMLMNLNQFRKVFSPDKIISFAQEHKMRIQEQDILNMLLEHKVKFLDLKYNFYTETNQFVSHVLGWAPLEYKEVYFHEKRMIPLFIHYASTPKPWNNPEIEFAEFFWETARKTNFYEILLSRLSNETAAGHISYHTQTMHQPVAPITFKKRIKNFLKIFFPWGTKRHDIAKKCYFKLRGWKVS